MADPVVKKMSKLKKGNTLYFMLLLACALVALLGFLAAINKSANALGVGDPCRTSPRNAHCRVADGDCSLCRSSDCSRSRVTVRQHHIRGETQMLNHMREAFHDHREWFVEEYIPELFVPALMLMAEQMSNIAMYQMFVVGKFFDAKSNLEAQRLFNELQNEAAKDYQPSESFCAIGTNARSLSHSEQIALNTQASVGQISMNRYLASLNAASSYATVDADKRSRWEQFTTTFCNRRDSNWTGGNTGLFSICTVTGANQVNGNLDIDYHRLVEEPRYLDIDHSFDSAGGDDAAQMSQASIEEQAIVALSRNLYGHNVPNSAIGFISKAASQERYLELRSVIAKRNVAQNSYNAIVGMKARGSGGGESAQFLRAVVADLGMTEPDINDIFGESPSYYAQLEVLGKKIFQSTDFFTNLYDKPANVKRKQAALNAIELMLDRAIFESELRNEMLMSVLLSSYLENEKELVYETYKEAKP